MDEDLERHRTAVLLQNDFTFVDIVALVFVQHLLDHCPILELDLQEAGEGKAHRIIRIGLFLLPCMQLPLWEFFVDESSARRHQVRIDTAIPILVAIEIIRLLHDTFSPRQV